MLLLETFLYIFTPPIIVVNSVYILLGIFLLRFALNKTYREVVEKCLQSKQVIRILLYAMPVVILSLISITVHCTYDISFVLSFLNHIFKLVIGVFLYAHFVEKGKKNPMLYCLRAFLLQSVIQIVSMVSSNISNILNIFRNSNVIAIGLETYGGMRGLALSSAGFFSLAAAYALMFVIILENWAEIRIHRILKIVALMCLLFGALSAGRTAFIGVVVALAVAVYLGTEKVINNGIAVPSGKVKRSTVIIVLCVLVIVLLYTLLSVNGYVGFSITEELAARLDRFYRYIFELWNNYLAGDGFSSTSTEKLFGMYFPVSTKTFFFGDGWYEPATGGYYMNTDAGYMRQILYFGIFGLISIFIYQSIFFRYKQSHRTKVCSISIFALLCVLHYKGEVVGFLQITQCILLLRMLSQSGCTSIVVRDGNG